MLPEHISRDYKVADPYIIQYAKNLRSVFILDQAAFVARDASFAVPYQVAWQLAIDDAENQMDDETMSDQLMQLTAAVEVEMDLCRTAFQDAKPFIKKAFPDLPSRWNELGFDNYDAARKNQVLLLEVMRIMHAGAERYALALIAANFTQPMIDALATRALALENANSAQELFKKQMQGATEQRVISLNAMYKICTTVCETGKRVMINSYAGYQRYLLPASDEARDVMALIGKVTATAVPPSPAAGIEDVTVNVEELSLSTTTDSNGNYGFGPIPAGTYTVRFSKVGFADVVETNVVVTGPESPVTVNATLIPMP